MTNGAAQAQPARRPHVAAGPPACERSLTPAETDRAPAVSRSSRRRGNLLLDAIYDAVLDELADVGYQSLSIEGIAKRAQTGKASIYRRWPSKAELVAATLDAVFPQIDDLPDTGDIRGDLLQMLTVMVDFFNSPTGAALQRILADTARSPMSRGPGDGASLHDIKEEVVGRRQEAFGRLLARGVERGQVRPGAVCRRVLAAPSALMMSTCLMNDGRVTQEDVVGILDDVLLPMVRAHRCGD